MDIQAYLDKTNTKASVFAKKINRHPSYVTKLKQKKLIPSLLESLVIFKASDGQINIEDMIPEERLKELGFLNMEGRFDVRLNYC